MKELQCIACDSKRISLVPFNVSGRCHLHRCENCKLSFLVFRSGLEEGELFDEYWDDVNELIYTNKNVIRELKDKYEFYLDKIDAPPNRKLLDVGSGIGIFVNTANEHGFNAQGIEPSRRACALSAEHYSINVECGLLLESVYSNGSFGVISAWDVIEHVRSPLEFLAICKSHLADDGILILETPDEGLLVRRVVRSLSKLGQPLDFRRNLYYEAHRYYFTRQAMVAVLKRCGFVDIHFYAERSMYEKELMKKQLYGVVQREKEYLYKCAYWILKRMPFLHNKMVVTARKS